MIGAYVRVSSDGQSDRTQRAAIRRAAAARGDDVRLWYAETASGVRGARGELERVREAARRGELRRLYVFALDRLTRRGIAEMFRIVDELRRFGCVVISLSDPIDPDNPAAEIILAVFAWAAKQEARRLGERISAARQRVEAAGGAWGRPRRMTSELAKKAALLKSKGKSIRYISAALKIPRATVGDALRLPSEKPTLSGRRSPSRKPGLKKTDPRPSE